MPLWLQGGKTMNKEEAMKVIHILLAADGGCQYCAKDLIGYFSKGFPEYKALAETEYKNKRWDE